MPQERFQIVARNRPRVMAEITTLLAHRRAQVISLAFTNMDPSHLHADLIVDLRESRERDLLRNRLYRLIDILEIVTHGMK